MKTLFCLLLALAQFVTGGYAAESATFRTLGVRRASPKLYFEVGGEQLAFFAGDTALSASYKAPASGKLELYTYVPAEEPELPPVKKTVAEGELQSEGESLVLVATDHHQAANGAAPHIQMRVVDASIEAHPIDTIRVFNFSKRRIAAKIADEFKEIPSAGESLFSYPEGNKVWVKIAAYEGGDTGWKLRTGGPKAIFPGKRTIIVISDAYPTREDPDGLKMTLRNIVDSQPPQPLSR